MEELNFKPIDLSVKENFKRYFYSNKPDISEYTFTNLYVWRNSRKISYAEYQGSLIIRACYNGENYLLPPIGKDVKNTYVKILEWIKKSENENSVRRIPEKDINIIKSNIEISDFKVVEDRDNFDYVFSSKDLAHLDGKKFSSKRNFYKKFLNEYNLKYEKYKNEYKNKCIDLMNRWIDKKKDDKTLNDEYEAIIELLNNFDNLNIVGSVIFADDNLAAFAFGEELNDDVFVIHFEKADTKYIGIYQTINKLFIENEAVEKYKYINREQDLGIPGIRKAKESYYPEMFIKKYNIFKNKF
ncbi:MAG: DUF2156 domain-containing protein [Spirochaetes bacterium]|nr:DUF2156 domain-containing protein [Spirochaetota bacterium]